MNNDKSHPKYIAIFRLKGFNYPFKASYNVEFYTSKEDMFHEVKALFSSDLFEVTSMEMYEIRRIR